MKVTKHYWYYKNLGTETLCGLDVGRLTSKEVFISWRWVNCKKCLEKK